MRPRHSSDVGCLRHWPIQLTSIWRMSSSVISIRRPFAPALSAGWRKWYTTKNAAPIRRKCRSGSRSNRRNRDDCASLCFSLSSELTACTPLVLFHFAADTGFRGRRRSDRNHFIVGIAELAPTRGDVFVTYFVNAHVKRDITQHGDDLAVLDFVMRGRAHRVGVLHVERVAWLWLLAVHTGDQASAVFAVEDFIRVAGNVVAHFDYVANDQLLQRGVIESGGALLFEIGNGHALGCFRSCFGGRRVPDRRRPCSLLYGQGYRLLYAQ